MNFKALFYLITLTLPLNIFGSSEEYNPDFFIKPIFKPQNFLRSGIEHHRVYRAKSYVGAVIPRNWTKSTGYQLDFTVCKPHSCTKRSLVTFGVASNYEKPTLLPINSQNYRIKQTLLHGPFSENIGNIYELVDWKRADIEVRFYDDLVTVEKDLVPNDPPPFVVIIISNGINWTKFIHLQNGAKKEHYGDLFNTRYGHVDVYEYCGTFTWDKVPGQEWKLGHFSICKWNPDDLNASFPRIPCSDPSAKC